MEHFFVNFQKGTVFCVAAHKFFSLHFPDQIRDEMLSDKFLEKAKSELREDESRKEQALEHFRQWIQQHQYIRSIRQGENVGGNCEHYS